MSSLVICRQQQIAPSVMWKLACYRKRGLFIVKVYVRYFRYPWNYLVLSTYIIYLSMHWTINLSYVATFSSCSLLPSLFHSAIFQSLKADIMRWDYYADLLWLNSLKFRSLWLRLNPCFVIRYSKCVVGLIFQNDNMHIQLLSLRTVVYRAMRAAVFFRNDPL